MICVPRGSLAGSRVDPEPLVGFRVDPEPLIGSLSTPLPCLDPSPLLGFLSPGWIPHPWLDPSPLAGIPGLQRWVGYKDGGVHGSISSAHASTPNGFWRARALPLPKQRRQRSPPRRSDAEAFGLLMTMGIRDGRGRTPLGWSTLPRCCLGCAAGSAGTLQLRRPGSVLYM